jgi:ABC-type multidrug transport system ATPase subunit
METFALEREPERGRILYGALTWRSPAEWRRSAGLIPHAFWLSPHLSGREHFNWARR